MNCINLKPPFSTRSKLGLETLQSFLVLIKNGITSDCNQVTGHSPSFLSHPLQVVGKAQGVGEGTSFAGALLIAVKNPTFLKWKEINGKVMLKGYF